MRDLEIKLVKFLHPGGEHIVSYDSTHKFNKSNAIKYGEMPNNVGRHRRKFIVKKGYYQTSYNGEISNMNDIMFWGEWEFASKFREIPYETKKRINDPKYIHYDFFSKKENGEYVNTDPYVFGEDFYYCCCQQLRKNGELSTKYLANGSLILFGSSINKKFVLDTLFVVKDRTPYNTNNINDLIQKKRLSKTYSKSGLSPLRSSTKDSKEFAFYTGATYKNPFNASNENIYSFFPCQKYKENCGFVRPLIDFSELRTSQFKEGQTQGVAFGDIKQDDIFPLWKNISEQVLRQGCFLGLNVEEPVV